MAGIGVGIVGCGHRPHAWSYARALATSSTARLVGVHDPAPELGGAVAADFSVPYHGDASSLIVEPSVDAVVVCSPTAEHRGLVELAASHGKHVLCEKPIATTIEDAEAMMASCRAAGVQLHVAFVTRFLPLVQELRAAVVAGQIGDLVGVVAGNRGRPPLPPHYPSWITTPAESGGGALIDHSVHLVDILRHLSGQEVRRVSAEVGAQLWDCGVDDLALMSLEFSAGLVASIDPSWSVPIDNPWDYDFFVRLLGSQGAIDIDDVSAALQLVSGEVPGMRLVPFGADADARMIEAFVASVRSGEMVGPCATGEDGLRALEVALAGYASAAATAPVELPMVGG